MVPDGPAAVGVALVVAAAAVAVPATLGTASPDAATTEPASRIPVGEAVADARTHLLDEQRDGHWGSNITSGEDAVVDVRLSFYYALLLERLDAHPRSKRAAVEWALSRRAPDGGWNDTVANYAALLLFERLDAPRYDDVAADVAAENRRTNRSLVPTGAGGGEGFVGTFRLRLLYALLSEEHTTAELFPDDDPAGFVTLARLTPAFEGDRIRTDESFVAPYAVEMVLNLMVLGLSVDGGASRGLAYDNLLTEGTWQPESRERARRELAGVLLARRDSTGTWMTTWDNVFAAFALAEVGYGAEDPEVRRALSFVGSERQAQSGRLLSIKIPVWDTAWATHALRRSGVADDDESMTAATRWLYEARTASPSDKRADLPLDRLPVPFRDHSGAGWGWKPHMSSDWDDTSVALLGLDGTGVDDERAVGFLFAVQNADGGWSAFATDFEPLTDLEREVVVEEAGEQFYHLLFASRSTPDVTGHALLALGRRGYSVESNESVRRAVEFLMDARGDDGLWTADWGKGATYGTSRALLGMAAVGADTDRRGVRRAVSEVLDRQNADGGWGVREGAPSRPTYTAWALQALLAAGVSPRHSAVRRGVRYLLETQRADGSWRTGRIMKNVGSFEYRLPVFAHASILLALVAYEEAPDRPPEQYDDGGGLPVSGAGPVATLLAVAVAAVHALRRRG